MTENCPSCGSADLGTFMCHYCGGPLFPLSGEAQQRQALDELHAQLTIARRSGARDAIFANGFLPDHPRVLIDAGLRMVPVLEGNANQEQAAGRMRAIILKLKLITHDEAAASAAAQLETHLERYERHDRLIARLAIGAIVIGVLAGAVSLVAAVVWWLFAAS